MITTHTMAYIKPYQTKSSLSKSYYTTQYDITMLPAFCHLVAPAICHIITPVFCHIIESTVFNIVCSTTIPYDAKPYNDVKKLSKLNQALLNHTILHTMIS